MKHYKNLEEAMCRELEMLDKKYGSDAKEMAPQDVERADVLYHALKSAATYHAMKDAEDWEEEDDESEAMRRGGRSSARRRDNMGRFASNGMPASYGMPDGEWSGRYPEWMYPPRRY